MRVTGDTAAHVHIQYKGSKTMDLYAKLFNFKANHKVSNILTHLLE